jgi:Lrp/AsnC family transcriptional regulator, leucine-responsive regulatory protein
VSDDHSSSSPPPLDAVDRTILRILGGDGRLSVAELARRATISRASAYARLERLTASGVIRGYTARIDHRAIGLEVAALILVTSEQRRWRELRDALTAVPEVEYLGLVAGDFDFMILVRATSTDELRDVVLDRVLGLPGIRQSRTMFLLDEMVKPPYVPAR